MTLRWKDQLSQMKLKQIRKKRDFKEDFHQLKSMQEIINQELMDGVIIPIQDSQVAFWNPIFAVCKKNGGFRKILDCRRPNSELMKENFQMDNVNSIKQIVKQGDFATSLDILYAFHHIEVAAKSMFLSIFHLLGSELCLHRVAFRRIYRSQYIHQNIDSPYYIAEKDAIFQHNNLYG
ncbi:MAG: hypothetical protein EZS28_022140 [Streblomastix strix]|uniref:Reverse transcriptase domain-containing protein n=1 Tax=Streblomastix strix TaxID=222440 RepID=A0A5J4VIB2_9EUKA|nr:MAG: hypothetical protein EZS28_022140 [Streblomastix strix]